MPGLKREAGENPAWSRHCNWGEVAHPSRKPLAVSEAGKAGEFVATRSQETCHQTSTKYASR